MKNRIFERVLLLVLLCIIAFFMFRKDVYFIASYEKASDNYYILVYTKNGETYYPHFTHIRQVIDFIKHLETRGIVYSNGYKISNEEQ